MNVGLEQVAALKYATIQLEATHVLVTLAISLLQTTKHAVVSVEYFFMLNNFSNYLM